MTRNILGDLLFITFLILGIISEIQPLINVVLALIWVFIILGSLLFYITIVAPEAAYLLPRSKVKVWADRAMGVSLFIVTVMVGGYIFTGVSIAILCIAFEIAYYCNIKEG